MPGPFPGMDPYLENPRFFKSFHSRIITYLEDELNRILPPGFAAQSEERLYTTEEEGGEQQRTIQVFSLTGGERVVAAVEMMSAADKEAGSVWRDAYARHRKSLFERGVHLLEVDLLRDGAHTIALPEAVARRTRTGEYAVCLRDAARPLAFSVHFPSVRDRLPRVALPLTPGVAPVVLDLQAAMDACYNASAFPRRVDYGVDPVPPLAPEDAAWADALLRGKGLRP
jgi:hypothetical protein